MKMIQNILMKKKKEEDTKSMNIDEIRTSRTSSYRKYANEEYPYRMMSSLYMVIIVVIFGIITYNKTIITYRAPFPIMPEKNVSISLQILISATDESLKEVLTLSRDHIRKKLTEIDLPPSIDFEFIIESIPIRSIKSIMNDNSLSSSLDFFIGLVPSSQWNDFSATNIVLTKGQWSLLQVRENDSIDKLLSRLDQLVIETLIGMPHIDLIVKRDRRERLEPWQIAAMSHDQQKRLTWDSTALSNGYDVRVVHIHSSIPSPSSSSSSSSSLIPSLHKLSNRLEEVTALTIKSEHLFDIDINRYLEEDVQMRQTISNNNLHLLLKEIDSHISVTQSIKPQLKIVVLHSNVKIVMLDQQDEDVSGAVIAEWGGVIMNDDRVTHNGLSILRVILGCDTNLPNGWKRSSVPLSLWELQRLRIRTIIDSSLRTKHAINALKSLLNDIDNLVFSDSVSSLISSSIDNLSLSLSNPRSPIIPLLRQSTQDAEDALFDPSLLSLLYFPTEQRFGIFLPIISLYFFPTLALIPRLIHYLLYRTY